MPTVTKSIGTSSRDYSTVTLWEADLDNTTPYDAGDDAVGEMYNDSNFDESVTINGGGTIGLNSVTLSVNSASRHTGVAGTGARFVCSTARTLTLAVPSGFGTKYTMEWFEFNANSQDGFLSTAGSNFGDPGILRNAIIHHASGGNSFDGMLQAQTRDIRVMNCIFYRLTRNTSSDCRMVNIDSDQANGGVFNTTVYFVSNSSGKAVCIDDNSNDANGKYKNNIAMGAAGTTSFDFEFSGTNPDSDYNMSSDATADDAGGTSNLLSKTASSQFVSIVDGSEDFHLKAGSDAIDTGVDLVTTPTNVNIDIDGRDRDAQADVWDIGADELVSATPSLSNWFQQAFPVRARPEIVTV